MPIVLYTKVDAQCDKLATDDRRQTVILMGRSSRGGSRNFYVGRPVKGQANYGQANRSGVRGDNGDDPRRLGRPGTSLGRPWPTRHNS